MQASLFQWLQTSKKVGLQHLKLAGRRFHEGISREAKWKNHGQGAQSVVVLILGNSGELYVYRSIVCIYANADIDGYAFQTELVFKTLARIHARYSNKIERKELTMAMTNVMCEMPHSCQKDEIIARSPRVRDGSANSSSSNDIK